MTPTPRSCAISSATSAIDGAPDRDRVLRDLDHHAWARRRTQIDAILRDNPHIHFGDSTRRGYVVFDVTAESCTVRLRAIEDPTDRRTGVSTAATFSVDAGRPGARRI